MPLLFAAVLFFNLISCAEEERDYIPDDYASWQRLNRKELDYPIPGHESHYRIIYINETGKKLSINSENGKDNYSFPDGTIIVKEIYPSLQKSEEEPIQLTAMIKDSDHPEARGGWIWVIENLGEDKQIVFTNEFCITCHANANEQHPYVDQNPREEFRDYVFFAPNVREMSSSLEE